jgi:hypothetical protein
MFFAQAGRCIERVDGGLEFGVRVVRAVFGEEEFRVADIAAPAFELAGFVVPQREPERIIGQVLQTLIIKVRRRI